MAAPQKKNKTVEKRGDKKGKSQRIMEKVSVGVGILKQIHRSSIGRQSDRLVRASVYDRKLITTSTTASNSKVS